MIIEVVRFRLAAGVDEAEWLARDREVQTDFAYQQPGLLRRTAVRGEDGIYAVITQWRSADDADAAAAQGRDDPLVAALMSLVEGGSVTTERYEPIG